MKVQKLKEKNGITLVALVVTIIILLILATVSIQSLTNTGLFKSANKAKLETKRSQITEWLSLNLFEVQANYYNKTNEEILEIARQNAEKSEELKKLGKTVDVDGEVSTDEDGEKVPPYFYVIVDDDMYRVSMSAQEFIGEVGKIVPYVDFEATTTTKSIILKVTAKRNQGGKLQYYIKSDNSDYGEPVTTTDKEYTFDNLTQNKTYTVKVVAVSGNGQKAEKTKEVKVGSIKELTASDIDFEYSVNGAIVDKNKWINQSVKVTAKPKGDIAGYTLATKKENGKWETSNSQTFSENGTMYVALSDGVNYGMPTTENIANIDIQIPQTTIQFSSISPITSLTLPMQVNINIEQTDSQSGINFSETKWVLSGSPEKIGTDPKLYTEKFSGENGIKTIGLNKTGKFYVHVLSIDNASNAIETVSQAISVTEKFHVHTGDSTNGGGCYGYHVPVYHYHRNECFKCRVCGSIGATGVGTPGSSSSSSINRCLVCGNISTLVCGKDTSTIDRYSGWNINCGKTEGVTPDAYEVSF